MPEPKAAAVPDPLLEPPARPPAVAPEPRQRWRAVFARTADAAPLAHREVVEALEAAFTEGPLPLLRDGRRGGRPRLTFAAPLPLGMIVERELFDLWLVELRPISEVRQAVSRALAPGYGLGDLYDVWLGAPALPASVIGAEYRVTLSSSIDADAIAAAISILLATASLPRERAKGSGTVAYDLRPLLAELELETGSGSTAEPRPELRIQVRFDPALGSGRPEEVIAALSDATASPLAVLGTRRSRLILAGAA